MTPPVLFLLGASHRTTPLELREKLALSPERLPLFYAVAAALPGLISTPSSQVARPPSGSAATTRMR